MNFTRMQRGIAIAVLHVALVSSLGAKLMYDRETRPRVWARTMPYDPDLPIRGRYIRLRVEVALRDFNASRGAWGQARLVAEDGQLTAVPSNQWTGESVQVLNTNAGTGTLTEPVAFFIPEHAQDPSTLRRGGDEIWVEVTVPKKGPPRPIRLGIKRNGGPIEPLPIN
jgi:hypothetical protein